MSLADDKSKANFCAHTATHLKTRGAALFPVHDLNSYVDLTARLSLQEGIPSCGVFSLVVFFQVGGQK